MLDALHLDTLGETFDTIVDSGLFHVFDDGARIHGNVFASDTQPAVMLKGTAADTATPPVALITNL